MILVLTAEAPGPQDEGAVVRRQARDADEVIGWVEGGVAEGAAVEKVVLVWPPAPALNPYALSRALRRANGPRLVIAGAPRPDQRFWAERNGCLLAGDLAEALAKE